jgi:hypothetical protein
LHSAASAAGAAADMESPPVTSKDKKEARKMRWRKRQNADVFAKPAGKKDRLELAPAVESSEDITPLHNNASATAAAINQASTYRESRLPPSQQDDEDSSSVASSTSSGRPGAVRVGGRESRGWTVNTQEASYTEHAQVIDDDELEAEYQAKMMMNAVAAEAVTEDELKAQRSGSRCRFLCCPLILVAIVLAIVVPLTNKPDPAPASTPSPTALTDYEYLYNVFYPISRDALLNETTPQFQALNWLAYQDPAMLPFTQSNSSTLVERYVAAVFYYSMGGPQWSNHLDFLSNHSICDWGIESLGVFCDETTNNVIHIELSKCFMDSSFAFKSFLLTSKLPNR